MGFIAQFECAKKKEKPVKYWKPQDDNIAEE